MPSIHHDLHISGPVARVFNATTELQLIDCWWIRGSTSRTASSGS